jgi:predicted ribosomally synthesized peptide with SipW-like signal peptide
MKPIVTSVGMIVFVAAIVAGGTGAFFSDTETSTGNVFTAGAIDLTVDSTQHYNNAVCVLNTQTEEIPGDYYWQLEPGEVLDNPQYPVIGTACDGTWLATNLGAHKFFNFLDVKPGDTGENTISLHVDNNDAYACIDVSITKNDDVTCTEPENDAEGTTTPCNTDGLPDFDGELAQNLEFFAWLDDGAVDGFQNATTTVDATEGDNIWQAGELPLFTNIIGPASDALDGESYTLADPIIGALVGSTTYYIGLEWCAGDLTTSGPGLLSCDGSTMGNDAQTDSMVADFAFRVEQARNNPNFSCTPRQELPNPILTLEKQVNQDGVAPVADANWTLTASGTTPGTVIVSGTDNDPDPSPAITAVSVPAGSYALTELGEVAGFTFQGIQCTAGVLVGNILTLVPGNNAVCTFTNLETNPEIANG